MKIKNKKFMELSKEELIFKITEMQEVLNHMEKEKDATELASLPWLGNLGQWHWMVQSDRLVFNKKKALNLGYSTDEIPKDAGFEYFTEMLHPDDYERVMDNMRNHLLNVTEVYEVEYRIKNKDGSYAWYYDRGKVTKRDEKGKAINVSGIVFDISVNKEMQSKLKITNAKLQKLVITDELTGAYNRRYMIEKLHESIKIFSETKKPFSLVMLDIDDFKLVNDAHGHNVGDIILQNLSDLIRINTRKTDILARWGGEEFILLLPNTHAQEAIVIAETIRIQLKNMKLKEVGNITASFGVVNYNFGDSVDTTIKRVDNLMYKAKDNGKDCVIYKVFEE